MVIGTDLVDLVDLVNAEQAIDDFNAAIEAKQKERAKRKAAGEETGLAKINWEEDVFKKQKRLMQYCEELGIKSSDSSFYIIFNIAIDRHFYCQNETAYPEFAVTHRRHGTPTKAEQRAYEAILDGIHITLNEVEKSSSVTYAYPIDIFSEDRMFITKRELYGFLKRYHKCHVSAAVCAPSLTLVNQRKAYEKLLSASQRFNIPLPDRWLDSIYQEIEDLTPLEKLSDEELLILAKEWIFPNITAVIDLVNGVRSTRAVKKPSLVKEGCTKMTLTEYLRFRLNQVTPDNLPQWGKMKKSDNKEASGNPNDLESEADDTPPQMEAVTAAELNIDLTSSMLPPDSIETSQTLQNLLDYHQRAVEYLLEIQADNS